MIDRTADDHCDSPIVDTGAVASVRPNTLGARPVIADHAVHDCQRPGSAIRDAAACEETTVANNRTVRNRESSSVRDPAAFIERVVRRDRATVDSQRALLIKDTGSREGRTALGHAPTANGQ